MSFTDSVYLFSPWLHDIPPLRVLPSLIEVAIGRAYKDEVTKPEQALPSEEHQRACIAMSCLGWSGRNLLIEHLEGTLNLTSDPDQKALTERLVEHGKALNKAEVHNFRDNLKLACKDDLWDLTVLSLKLIAKELRRRGIDHPSRPGLVDRLSKYIGSGIHKRAAVDYLWEVLNALPSG